MVFWDLVLESPKCLIHIFQERSDIFLTLAPPNAATPYHGIGIQDQIGLHPMVYYVTKGTRFVGLYEKEFYMSRRRQLRALANLLEEYLDQIAPYFGNPEFWQHQGDLLSVQKEYNDLLVKKYVYEKRKREPFDQNA
jgi:hypothetical protein